MRQVFRKIPVYTGDVSGVCSALFELGGMVVMHDPSGCNSTYNTHDEIRWYDHDSLIFLSGLDEMDAIMGSDDRLIHDIAEAARIYSPEFIAVANSPIPYITGMDFEAVCRAVEQVTGIPSFYISTNGMHDYVHGAGLALLRIAERFTAPGRQETEQDPGLSASAEFMKSMKPMKAHRITCNLLGVTPLDFANPSTLPSLYSKFSEAGGTSFPAGQWPAGLGMKISAMWRRTTSIRERTIRSGKRLDSISGRTISSGMKTAARWTVTWKLREFPA